MFPSLSQPPRCVDRPVASATYAAGTVTGSGAPPGLRADNNPRHAHPDHIPLRQGCAHAPARAPPATRRAPAPLGPARTSAERSAQFCLGDYAAAQQIVGNRADPALIVAQPVVIGLGDRFDPAPQLVDAHHALPAEDLADRVHLTVEIAERMDLPVHVLAEIFRHTADVVMGAGLGLVHGREDSQTCGPAPRSGVRAGRGLVIGVQKVTLSKPLIQLDNATASRS